MQIIISSKFELAFCIFKHNFQKADTKQCLQFIMYQLTWKVWYGSPKRTLIIIFLSYFLIIMTQFFCDLDISCFLVITIFL